VTLLVIDIGNTNTVIGIYRNKTLVESWRLISSHTRTVDEFWIMEKLLCNDAGINTGDIKGVIISSVVPELTKSFVKMSQKYLSVEPVIVGDSLNLGLKLLIREPKQLGADRICNAVAARKMYTTPLIVVDLGTATTFDVLDKKGDYIGGAISPGLLTGSLELIKKASQLHEIDLTYPENIIGKTTKEHLQSGIFVGHIAMIEGLVNRIKKEFAETPVMVIATGGYCQELQKHTPDIDVANPNLTLEGLYLIYEMNRSWIVNKP